MTTDEGLAPRPTGTPQCLHGDCRSQSPPVLELQTNTTAISIHLAHDRVPNLTRLAKAEEMNTPTHTPHVYVQYVTPTYTPHRLC